MVRRTSRTEMPPDPAGIVRALRTCRDAMTNVQRQVKLTGPAYHGASMVMAAIDGFTTFLTGQCHYFWATGSSSSGGAGQEHHDRLAREEAEKPWQE